jgi:hypothetical protein
MPDVGGRECTCDFKPATREYARMRNPFNGYAIYLDEIEDETTFDPACPFHGDNGSMVARVPVFFGEGRTL